MHLVPDNIIQTNLFEFERKSESKKITAVNNALNDKFGKNRYDRKQ